MSSNNYSTSRSTRSQCLKRKRAAEDRGWDNLYNDLLILVLEYCNQLVLTQLVMRINQYWSNTAKSIRVWNNRSITLRTPPKTIEFRLFINTRSYLINVSNWCWYRLNNYHPLTQSILSYQSKIFNQLKSIKFNRIRVIKSDMIVIFTKFNSLISLSFIECYMESDALNQFHSSGNIIGNINRNIIIKPNLLLTHLKRLELDSTYFAYKTNNINFLYNLIELESLIMINCGMNRIYNHNNNNNPIEFYSLIANRMPLLTYLNTNECKIAESTELQLNQLTAISQLIQRLKVCSISKPKYPQYEREFNSSDWVNIFKLHFSSINNTSPLQHIKLHYSAELIEYLVQFPALTRLDITTTNLTTIDLKSLSALSALTELHLSPYQLDPLIFPEFQFLTKLKILNIHNLYIGRTTPFNYYQFNQLLIELLKCNSLIELYINITIELPLNQENKQQIISIELIEFIGSISKFTKIKFLYISQLTLNYFSPEFQFNEQYTNNLTEWFKQLHSKLSKLLPNTTVRTNID